MATEIDIFAKTTSSGGDDKSPAFKKVSKFEEVDAEITLGFDKSPTGKFRFFIGDNNGKFYKKRNGSSKYTIQIPAYSAEITEYRLLFSLDSKVDWSFDWQDGKAPMRFVDEYSKFYTIEYVDGNWKQFMLVAQARDNAEPDKIHSFNLYVLIAQENGPALPVRFDPDVDNPPL